ncbi:unnamed protein product [Callosobruchus maculatus]|nr:unnamed protein product [Callosobruchus maculatus]
MFGLFYENGPFSVNGKGELELRNHSWHNNHSVIYIDNPVGTGFSFTNNGYARNQTQIGKELYGALKQFYQIFPELKKNEFFITGESYAGKYVPTLAHTIHKNNPTAAEKINLKGVAMGNPYIDPKLQVGYAELLYQIGLVDKSKSLVIKDLEVKDVQFISEGKYNESNDVISEIFNIFDNVTGGTSIFNFLQDGSSDQEGMEAFFNTSRARMALHVGNTTFGDDQVYENLSEDNQKNDITPWFVEVVENYRVMLYTGQLDIIVAYALTSNFLEHVNFKGVAEFQRSKRKVWYVDEDIAGYVKTFGNFSDVLVRNAGHMVPTDQPKHAEDLIYKFTRNLPLSSD